MTLIDGILTIVFVISLMVLLFIAVRKMPQVSLVDPLSSREAKVREKKKAMVQERVTRQAEEKAHLVWKNIRPFARALQDGFRRFAGKLTALERRYLERQRQSVMDKVELRRMVDEAQKMMNAAQYDVAEKMLIAVVSHDPKNVPAYEILGRIYFTQKQYEEARETWEFLAKMSPKDASVFVALGEVFAAQGQEVKAFEYYSKARDISPNNPKYLDFFIHSAIAVRNFLEAQRAIDHLRQVNPDNKKIPEFESMLAEARKAS